MNENLNEMMEWGASTIDLLKEVGFTEEEISEVLESLADE